jgi:hypothetical protein
MPQLLSDRACVPVTASLEVFLNVYLNPAPDVRGGIEVYA